MRMGNRVISSSSSQSKKKKSSNNDNDDKTMKKKRRRIEKRMKKKSTCTNVDYNMTTIRVEKLILDVALIHGYQLKMVTSKAEYCELLTFSNQDLSIVQDTTQIVLDTLFDQNSHPLDKQDKICFVGWQQEGAYIQKPICMPSLMEQMDECRLL